MKKLLLIMICLLTYAGQNAKAQCVSAFSYYINSTSPVTVSFSDSSFSPVGIASYVWDFGDGSFGSQPYELHTYPSTGVYNVCLTITDSSSCTNTTCQTVTALPPPPVVVAYLITDSMSMFNCTSPATVSYYYYSSISGLAITDSVLFEINYGDGVDSTFYYYVASGGSPQGTFVHQYLNAGTYTAQLTITAPGNITSTSTADPVIVSSSCGSVSGSVYNDLNGNCTFDLGEELANIPLEIYIGTALMGWTNTDASGAYSFNVPTGNTYEIRVSAFGGYYGHFAPTCPATGIITVSTIPSTGNNFGVACPAGFDLQGNLTGWGFRPGFVASVCVYAYNQRCNSPSGQIEITFPSTLTPQPDSSGAYTISGNTVTYTINAPDLWWSFCIPVLVSTSAQIGDSVCIDMIILPVIGDSVPSNNTGTFCFPVRNSWDPNDKYATPTGEGPTGAVRPNTTLTYNIRFQNTGNADAINIFILDSLSTNLDASSVEVIGSSHDMTWSLLTGNILRFNFDNINLADSNSNEPASHGYVTYRIKQLANLAQSSQIFNTAGIYFDFNPPVITNTTLHTIDQTLSVQHVEKNSALVNVYPNPANGKCHLYFNDNHMRTISVTDALGKIVIKNSVMSDNYVLNTEKLAEGIYTIHVSDDLNRSDAIKLIVAH